MSGAFKSGAMGGLMGLIMSALSNYYLFPMPSTLAGIAIGNNAERRGFACGDNGMPQKTGSSAATLYFHSA